MIYLDNAATTEKKPEMVVRSVTNALKMLSVNPGRGGYETSMRCGEMIYDCRKKVAELFGVSSPDRVVFTQNCTVALNFVIKGLLEQGDHVICSCLEHNAVTRPLYKLEKMGVEVDVAEVVFTDEDATVHAFEGLIKPNTKLVICTHASNVTGHIMPIAKIGAMCKQHGVLFAVDAAQTAGIIPINMQQMNIDYLCVAPHKGLYAPMGTGLMIAMKDLQNTVVEGGTGTASALQEQPDDFPEKFESGTVNVPGIAGVSAGIDFLKSKTIEKIYLHEIMLAQRLFAGFGKIKGLRVYSSYPVMGKTVPTISINIGTIKSEVLAQKLASMGVAVRAGLHCAPSAHKRIGTIDTGTVRICFSYFNSVADVDYCLNCLEKISKLS